AAVARHPSQGADRRSVTIRLLIPIPAQRVSRICAETDVPKSHVRTFIAATDAPSSLHGAIVVPGACPCRGWGQHYPETAARPDRRTHCSADPTFRVRSQG